MKSAQTEALKKTPWRDLVALAKSMLVAGHEKGEVADVVAAALDALIPFPAPLEAIDGPVLKALVDLVVSVAAKSAIAHQKVEAAAAGAPTTSPGP